MILSFAVIAVMLLSSLAVVPGKVQASTPTLAFTGTSGLAVATVPSAPRNLVADQGPGFNWLWWDHPTTQGTELIKTYEIWRGESSGGETLLDTIYVGNTSFNDAWMGGLNVYNDTSVVLEEQYWYKIRALSDAGAGPFSNEVSAWSTLTGNAPGAPNVSGINKVYSAQIDWTKPSDEGSTPVRFYFIYRDPAVFVSTLMQSWYTETSIEDVASTMFTQMGVPYTYTIRAVNTYGQGDPGEVIVTIGGTGDVPNEPTNLTASGGNKLVWLYWDIPTNPSEHGFEQYDIFRATGAGPYVFLEDWPNIYGYLFFYYDMDVANGNTYHYKIRANNSYGVSAFSNVASATPTASPPPPLEVSALNAYPGNNRALLIWSHAYNSTGYDIYRSESPGTEAFLISVGNTYYYFDDTVLNGHTYYYKVKPKHLSDIGPFSPEANVSPGSGSPPAAPTSLIATPDWDGVEVHLFSVQSSSILLGYEVYRGNSSGGESPTPVAQVQDLGFDGEFSWFDPNADPDVNYYYTVKLRNMYGLSPASNEASSFASPTGDVPDPVTNLVATSQSGAIGLSWSSPTYQGTANLLRYEVQRNNTQGDWIGRGWFIAKVGTVSWQDTLVVPGVTYQFRVIAMNNYGDSSGSNVVSGQASAANQPPSAPRNLVANGQVGQVVLTWDAPTSPGTSAITRYDIFRGLSAGTIGATAIDDVPAGTLTYADTTANPGTTYYYVVKAVNSVGSSPASNVASSSASPPPAVPNPPQNLAANGHDGYVILTWDAPTSPGTSPITRYDVFRGTSAGSIGATPIGNVAAGTLTYNDSTVTNGQTYHYQVKAVNSVGSSAASNTAQATPSAAGTAPGAPTNLVAVGHVGYIQLSWVAPSNVGSGVANYLIYRGIASGGQDATPLATVSGGSLTYSDDSATPGTPYYYKVKASNSYGASELSNEATGTATEQISGTPTAPQNLLATPGEGKVTLSWQAPASDGGSAITGYKVYRSTGGTPTLLNTVSASTLTYEDTTGTQGVTYAYSVVATNANGAGLETEPVNAASQEGGGGGTDNTMLYVGIGVVLIVVVGAAAFLFMRKKPGA